MHCDGLTSYPGCIPESDYRICSGIVATKADWFDLQIRLPRRLEKIICIPRNRLIEHKGGVH